MDTDFGYWRQGHQPSDTDIGIGTTLLVVGAAGWLGLTIWEAIDTYHCAEEFNERQQGVSLSLSPMVVPPPAGVNAGAAPAVGLGLSGRF